MGGNILWSQPYLFEYRSRCVEKTTNVPELIRRQVDTDGPHSMGVTGNKRDHLSYEEINGNVDGAGLGSLE